MKTREFYNNLANLGMNQEALSKQMAEDILLSSDLELLPLLNAAYEVRRYFVGTSVKIHIINNTQNGFCPEDCHYCAQAKTSQADIEEYPIKSDDEILAEAKNAYEKGAFRYCMVFAGRGPNQKRTEHLASLVRQIKEKYPLQICISCGLLNDDKAKVLKEAGLDRLNHNLNTSEKHYPEICTTHTYKDRLNTLSAGRKAGIQLCSGMIVGMGETHQDIIEVAYTLRELQAESIPINFLIPIEGNNLKNISEITPEFCLRILCLFRFLNPKCELRIAAGREIHLRQLQVLGLYPANSLFLEGYLNTRGDERLKTLQMIKDAGFTIESEIDLNELIEKEKTKPQTSGKSTIDKALMKNLKDLRPAKI
jgi:biotin synthase